MLAGLMDGGPGTVAEVAKRLRPTPAYTTVMTELVALAGEGAGYAPEARQRIPLRGEHEP